MRVRAKRVAETKAVWSLSALARAATSATARDSSIFLDPATLEPFEDQWAYLSSVVRLSTRDLSALARALPDPQFGHKARRLQLPTSSKIVSRPSAIVHATFGSRITLTANDLGPAMISAVKHAAAIRNPEFDARQRARRSTWDTPRFLHSSAETADGDVDGCSRTDREVLACH
jgi:hypothetical protein